MSAHMKNPLIKVEVGDQKFKILKKDADLVLSIVKNFSERRLEEVVPLDVVFNEIAKSRPKGAIFLRGYRTREGLSQKDLEKKTGILFSNISKYENGTRKITESVAKKFASVFKVKYQKFME